MTNLLLNLTNPATIYPYLLMGIVSIIWLIGGYVLINFPNFPNFPNNSNNSNKIEE